MEVMREFPAESIDMVMFSPPYWGLRDYGEKSITIWGDTDCEHEWTRHVKPKERGSYGKNSWMRPSRNAEAKWVPQISSFCVKCGAWKGQLGLEPTWHMYVDHMRQISREIKRVLKKTGSMYIVLGDTYAGSHCGKGDKTLFQNYRRIKVAGNLYDKPSPQAKAIDYKPKCLMGIPWRVAFALIEDGWILRNDIIWHKPNAMPSSVKDRLTQTYEHIFHFVKARRYYYDLDAIREPHKTAFASFNLRVGDVKRGKGGISAFGELKASKEEVENYVYPESGRMRRLIQRLYEIAKQIRGQSSYKGKNADLKGWKEACSNAKAYRDALKILEQEEKLTDKERKFLRDYTQNHLGHPLGKNPGDVISKRVKANLEHFLPRGSGGHYTYGGIDSKAGKHKHPLGKNPGDVVLTKHDLAVNRVGNFSYTDPLHIKAYNIKGKNPGDYWSVCTKPFKGAHFAVYPEGICVKPILSSCPPNGIVLDPMCGSGTTLVVAKKLGRKYIGIDINPEYVDIAIERLL
jgi:DNA modification methylase